MASVADRLFTLPCKPPPPPVMRYPLEGFVPRVKWCYKCGGQHELRHKAKGALLRLRVFIPDKIGSRLGMGDCAAGQENKQTTVLWAQSERVCNAHKGQKWVRQ